MGQRSDISANFTGATLIYGPEAPRPDLILAGQFLIDDMRRSGLHPGALRINSRSLRLRMEGMDLALAITSGPLPAEALMDLMRPVLPAQAAPEGPFTNITHLRVQTSLRRHALALGVLLRRRHRSAAEPGFREDDEDDDLALTSPGQRGIRPKTHAESHAEYQPAGGRAGGLPEPAGSETLWHTLHPAILAVSEAAPPGLVIWQPTGVVYSAAEFGGVTLERLAEQGDPAVILRPLAIRRPASRPRELVLPTILTREDRAATRSAGRLFTAPPPEAAETGPARAFEPRRERALPPLPRLEGQELPIQTALRGGPRTRRGFASRWLGWLGLGRLGLLSALWLALPAPSPGPGLPVSAASRNAAFPGRATVPAVSILPVGETGGQNQSDQIDSLR